MKSAGQARGRIALLCLALLAALSVIANLFYAEGQSASRAAQFDLAAQGRLLQSYGNLPLSFEPNHGQTDAQVEFLSRGAGYTLFLTSREAVLTLSQVTSDWRRLETRRDPAVVGRHSSERLRLFAVGVLRMRLIGAKQYAPITGVDELPGKSNYFVGNDPIKWRTQIPTYARVKCAAVYPGVDLVYHGNRGQLEYDFVVAPGTDPGVIALSFTGARHITVDPETADLLMRSGTQNLRFKRPVVYQPATSLHSALRTERSVDGRYRVSHNHVTSDLSEYDHSRLLVIDPVLAYSTFLGGSNSDRAVSIALDASGNAYLTGSTCSTDFPTTPGAFQTVYGGGPCSDGDAFGW
jgi:hypothetical protein